MMVPSCFVCSLQNKFCDPSAGYRSVDSTGTGAFLADMKVGVPNKGLSMSDRINDALLASDQVVTLNPFARVLLIVTALDFAAHSVICSIITHVDQNYLRNTLSSSPSSLYSDSRALGLMASIDKQATFARISGANASVSSSSVFGVSSPSDAVAVPVQKVVVLQGSGDARSSKSAAGIAASAPNKFAKT